MDHPDFEHPLRPWQIVALTVLPLPSIGLLIADAHPAWLILSATLALQAGIAILRWTPKSDQPVLNHLLPYLPPAKRAIVPGRYSTARTPRQPPQTFWEACQRFWTLVRAMGPYIRQPTALALPAAEERVLQRAEAILYGYGSARRRFDPCDAIEALRLRLAACQREELWAVVYDGHPSDADCLGVVRICGGRVDELDNHVIRRELHAVVSTAAAGGVLLIHNHPSGYADQSRGDLKSLNWLRDIFQPLKIEFWCAVVSNEGTSRIVDQWGTTVNVQNP